MPFDELFRIANTVALACWIVLIALPRRAWIRLTMHAVVIGGLCLLYALLVYLYFFRVQGGGFGTLAAVQRLFESPAVALAGWLHYLAFDLLVGDWIAERSDAIGLSRWLQAPLLATTFMFAPIGVLLFAGLLGVRKLRMPVRQTLQMQLQSGVGSRP